MKLSNLTNKLSVGCEQVPKQISIGGGAQFRQWPRNQPFCPLIFIVSFNQCSKCWDSEVHYSTYASYQIFIPSCLTVCALLSET